MKALLVNKNDDGYQASITEISGTDLPDGDVTVAVDYSTLNYKASLAITGASGAVYGLRLLEMLIKSDEQVYLMISKPAQIVPMGANVSDIVNMAALAARDASL